ncbi:hypothetical protein GCM10010384_09250 [Streptomyces djakartensis]|uniref:Uncharacterized protein n=1 Tax=Streptomyces djakartensis TaxID=68193 RepID=A0ABQ2ZB26_9ACTN|nr:hypothetical protein GCM10010384_09250 [Streptomyces djakartensis]
MLAAIGACVAAQAGPITVHLPGPLAEAAVAAWNREETTEPPQETPDRHALRDAAAELALIGLAIEERGRREGEGVTVELDVASAGAAARAVR